MAEPDTDVIDAAHQVIVLAFDLVDAEIASLPEQIQKALLSPAVQKAITKSLLDFAKSKSAIGNNTVVSDEEAKKLADALRTGVTDAATKELMEKVKATSAYKQLQESIEAFQKAAKHSSLGVWIDKNKNVLYVVGAALVLGSASALYITKTGGTLLNAALDPLKGKEFEVLQVGKLTIKAGLWDFQPDARILGARVFGTLKWEQVKLDLRFGVLAQDAKVQQAEGGAVLKAGQFSVDLSGTAKPQKQVVDLGLKVGYQAGKFNLGLGAKIQDNILSGTASAEYKTRNATFGLQGNLGQKDGNLQYGALLTVSIPVNL
ncbi:MAG: hypothetical protein ACJ8FU_06875 [Xanthobacteraceae bacterium]|jgi:hypothetical protein